ncbi:MAG: hypothetical protein SWI22_13365 [Pseudomonadota bacterium]|nr:hypothetical protein [Pseudomonadota bacterium]
MKHRSPSIARIDALVIREVQRDRLVRIARGQIEPVGEREGFFQWWLLQGQRATLADFILPPLLYIDEQCRLEAAGEPGGA